MTKIETTAERVANNVLITAAARLAMVFGVPIILSAGAWALGELHSHERRIGRVEVEKTELTRRIGEVERRDTEDSARMAARFATIEAALASMAAQQAATLRSVERIERVLDAQRNHGGPR